MSESSVLILSRKADRAISPGVSTTPTKPKKPRRDFPLFPHPNGLWAKKIKGKCWYFGSWKDDPKGQAALERFVKERDAIHAGHNRRDMNADGYTLGKLSNEYLNAKKADMAQGKITPRHFHDLHRVCDRLVSFFGAGRLVETIGPDDFEKLSYSYPSTWKLRRRKREIVGTRSIFNYAAIKEKILKTRFGTFKAPKADELAAERFAVERKHGNREFTPEQLRTILDTAPVPLKAMAYLGINCGFNNTDCAELTTAYLDLEKCWVEFPRVKTTIKRRAYLWPETVKAIRDALKQRPEPRDADDTSLVFISPTGLRYVRVDTITQPDGKVKVRIDDGVVKAFSRLLRQLKIKRRGLSFTSLRHCCETFGGTDQVAVDATMGHVTPGMGSNYRQSIADDRIRAVSASIYQWLFGRPLFKDQNTEVK